MNWFSTIGLILDIFGVLILLKFGFPTAHKIIGGKYLMAPGTNQYRKDVESKKYNSRIKLYGVFGIIITIAGFLLQVIGTNLQFFKSLLKGKL